MFHISKPDNAERVYRFDWSRALEQVWRASTEYGPTEFVRPRIANGFEYEATNPGQSDAYEPRWPVTIGETVVDGSLVWTCRDFGTEASDTIEAVSVVSLDGELTIGRVQFIGMQAIFEVSGGVAGNVHDIEVTIITTAGETDAATLRVTIT